MFSDSGATPVLITNPECGTTLGLPFPSAESLHHRDAAVGTSLLERRRKFSGGASGEFRPRWAGGRAGFVGNCAGIIGGLLGCGLLQPQARTVLLPLGTRSAVSGTCISLGWVATAVPMDVSQAQVCGESCGQQPGLEQHKGSSGTQVFICGTCGKVLSCHSRLAAHQMVHSGARSFACLECGQTFRWVSNLLRHQRNHTSEKTFRCELCGHAFRLKARLVQHRKVHTGHRPYECDACGKAFKQKSNLLRHQLVHTGERPFHCAICCKDFRTKENLNHHQRIHSGEKPYTCSECGKAFRWSRGFSIHQRLHLTKRVYKCEHCGKGFRHLGFFTRHQRTHGRGEV
ncbi:Zinc finger protein 707 [Fukomys damarensis]|uniref:Zinc finger protein 707 n=1 Tax=Fukomys damarensis TaxID=885580 RepID=A0A091DJG9_FUKDA|nr:Zinc finger protein 707 [Fukomys damarensis]